MITSIKIIVPTLNSYLILPKLIDSLKIEEQKINENGILKNKTFMFTGKLTNISRSEAKNLIELNSGSIISNVSKKLDFLVAGEKPTKKKVDRAKELKIKILSQSDLLKMINMTS